MTPREIAPADTDFAIWRRQKGFTFEQAAEALKASASHVKNWEAGRNRSRNNPIEPPHAVKVLMTAGIVDRMKAAIERSLQDAKLRIVRSSPAVEWRPGHEAKPFQWPEE